MQTTSEAFRFAAFVLPLFVAAAPSRAADNLLTTPGAAARAVADIVAKIGREPSVSLIDIASDGVTLQAQGKKDFHVDEYRWELLDLWFFQRPYVSGPNPTTPHSVVDDISGAFFRLAGVALDRVPEIAAASIKRAALEDEAEVTRIRVERSASILPQAYGEPRFAVSVSSGREHATVFTALDGTITGADVSGTQRARMLDLLGGDKYLAEAQVDLAAALGPEINVRELGITKSGISVSTEHSTKKDYALGYYWNLNGVSRNPVDSLDISSMTGDENDVAFKIADLDFSVLPTLKKAVLDALKIDGGKITRIEAERLVTGVRAPQLSWTVDIEDEKGEKGKVIADARGMILEVIEPEGRRPKLDWLAGSTIRAALDRIFAKFDKGTRFRTILINDERGNVEVADPLKPSELASFVVDDTSVEPFGTAFPGDVFGMGPDEPRMFTSEEMAGYDAATLDTLKQRALERLALPNGKIVRLTFERGNVFVASPRGNVLVEICADPPDGRSGGRVTYEPDGTELDVVMP